MPTVVIPVCFLDSANTTPDYASCRIEGRTVAVVILEMFQRFPALLTRFRTADGRPRMEWFGLYRERDGEDLFAADDLFLGDDDRIHLINLIGC
jgi:hypothetical protein